MIIIRYTAKRLSALTLALLLNLTSIPAFGNGHRPIRPPASAAAPGNVSAAEAENSFGHLPLSFEINQGQAADAVKFLARGKGYGLFLTAREAVFQVQDAGPNYKAGRLPRTETLRLQLSGANTSPQISGLDELPGKSSYFTGSDPAQWRTGIASYARVEYRAVWPGVNLIYYGRQHQLEYDFVVAPGADPRAIRLTFAGAQSVRIDRQGDLVLSLSNGEIRQAQPLVYQEINGERQFIPARYVISRRQGKPEIGFRLGTYDRTKTLVIDPVLSYATLLGGSGNDNGQGIAVDAQGNVYVTGFTASTNFPGAVRVPAGSGGNGDAFVLKLNPAGNQIVYAAYIGGSGADAATDLALDGSNNVWLAGYTSSTDFPTVSPRQAGNAGGTFDGFVAKLNASGTALSFSTYLGGPGTGATGSGDDRVFGIAVDADGSALVTGQTNSASFPLQNPLRNTIGGGFDAFVTKYNSTGSAIVYSTYLGGSADDVGQKIAVDSSRNAYVTGFTAAVNFPTTAPLQAQNNGNRDAFVTKLNASGSAFVYSTYLGGSADDIAYGIAIDSSGNAYVSGVTSSTNFPAQNPVQTKYGGGGTDAFVTRLNAAGSALAWSTWLGGSGDDYASRIAVDAAGQAHVTGNTFSTNFPLENIVPGAAGSGSDAFIVKFNAAGSARLFATYYGGNGHDYGNAIALDAAGNAYVTGDTGSTSLPVAAALQASPGGGGDAFIVKLDTTKNLTSFVTVSAASYASSQLAPESIVAGFGPNVATGLASASSLPLPTVLGGVSIKVRDANGVERPAPLFFVSPNQINYQIPEGTAPGRAAVSVLNSSNAVISAGVINVAAISPALFTGDASGGGAPAAYAIRVRASGQQSVESVSNGATPMPIDVAPPGDQVYLVLYGTGIRGRSAQNNVTVNFLSGSTILAAGGVDYASVAPGFVGLDQVNLVLPRNLAGRGVVDLVIIADGQTTNAVRVSFK